MTQPVTPEQPATEKPEPEIVPEPETETAPEQLPHPEAPPTSEIPPATALFGEHGPELMEIPPSARTIRALRDRHRIIE